MLAGTLFFSIGSVCIKLAGARLPTLEILFARSAIMAVYCFVLARRAGAYIPGHRKPLLVVRGVLGFAAYFCLFYAIIHLPLADATVITLAFPVVVPVWAALLLGERLEPATLLCILLGAAGMVLITRPPLLFGGASAYAPLAVAAAVGSALLSSICVTLVRKLTRTEHPLVIVLYAASAGTLGAPLFPLLGAGGWLMPTWAEAAALLGMGLCMSMGQHCITVGYSRSSAARTSVLFYMEVVFAAVWGVLLFGEVPAPLAVAGALLIIGGAVLLALRKEKS
jgi:drug/metabolite transporter (DMT)-like permease